MAQTFNLVDIILNEINKGKTVEISCVWAGDYGIAPELNDVIDTKRIDLKENFEIAEKIFTTFI